MGVPTSSGGTDAVSDGDGVVHLIVNGGAFAVVTVAEEGSGRCRDVPTMRPFYRRLFLDLVRDAAVAQGVTRLSGVA